MNIQDEIKLYKNQFFTAVQAGSPHTFEINRKTRIKYINEMIFNDIISEGFKQWKQYGKYEDDEELLCICGHIINVKHIIQRGDYYCILGCDCVEKFDEEYGTDHVKDYENQEKKKKQTCICGDKKTMKSDKCKQCIKRDELIKQEELKNIKREECLRVEREKRQEQLRLQQEEQLRLSKICPQCSGCKPINNFKYCFRCNEKNKLLKTKKCIKCNIPKKDDKYDKCFKCNEEDKIKLDF